MESGFVCLFACLLAFFFFFFCVGFLRLLVGSVIAFRDKTIKPNTAHCSRLRRFLWEPRKPRSCSHGIWVELPTAYATTGTWVDVVLEKGSRNATFGARFWSTNDINDSRPLIPPA